MGNATLKPYPAYKPSGTEWLGDVPAHWTLRSLKYLSHRIQNGATPPTNEPRYYENGTIPWYGPSSCSYQPTVKSPIRYLNQDALDEGKARLIHAPALLIVVIGATAGRMALLADDGSTNQQITAFELNPALANPLHVLHQVRSAEQWLRATASTATLPILDSNVISRLPVAFPALDEQTAIVHYLDRADDRIRRAISVKERLIELLTEQRQAVTHRAVTRGLGPKVPLKDSGVEWLGDVPEHWDVRRLRHTGEAIIGLTYSPQDVVDEGAGTLVLRASNIFEGQLNYQDSVFVNCPIPERLVVKDGDILLCSRSGSRALIGKNAKIDSEVAGATFGAFMTVFRSESNDYLHHVFNSKLFENQSGAFLTSTINQLTLGILNDFKVPWPPSEERTAVIRYLDKATANINTAIDKAQRQIDLLREYRTRLIADVVMGQVDVRGAIGDKVELPVS